MNIILKQKVFSEMNRKMNYLVNKYGSEEDIPKYETDQLFQYLVLFAKTSRETEMASKKSLKIPVIKFKP